MSKFYPVNKLFNIIGNATSLTSIKGDVNFNKNLICEHISRRRLVKATSCTQSVSEARTAACVIQVLTCKVTAEVFPCMTLAQILVSGNLSEDHYCLIDMCIEAELYEETLSDQLVDSIFILFPSLEAFWFNGAIIRREEL